MSKRNELREFTRSVERSFGSLFDELGEHDPFEILVVVRAAGQLQMQSQMPGQVEDNHGMELEERLLAAVLEKLLMNTEPTHFTMENLP